MLGAAVVYTAAAAPASSSQEIWDILQDFGYTGVLASNCGRPDSYGLEIKRGADGKTHKRILSRRGLSADLTSTIDMAERLSTSTLSLRLREGPAGLVNDQVIEKKDGRFRLFDSKGVNGQVVKDGMLSSKVGTPWIEKCAAGQTPPLGPVLAVPPPFHVITEDLELRNIRSTRRKDGAPAILIEGTVANVSRVPRQVPRLKAVVRSATREDLKGWTFSIGASVLQPDSTLDFRFELSDPPQGATDVVVSFER
jgi:hypothetical protein